VTPALPVDIIIGAMMIVWRIIEGNYQNCSVIMVCNTSVISYMQIHIIMHLDADLLTIENWSIKLVVLLNLFYCKNAYNRTSTIGA